MVNTLNKNFLRFPSELSVFFIEKTSQLQLTLLVNPRNNSCFLCTWDSRARDQHYNAKGWPHRKTLELRTRKNERCSKTTGRSLKNLTTAITCLARYREKFCQFDG